MQSRKPFYLFISILFIVGIITTAFRHIEQDVPLVPGEQIQSWAIDAKLSFQGSGEPVELTFALPSDPAFEIIEENATSSGYGLTIAENQQGRRALWSHRQPQGNQQLFYSATLIPTKQTQLLQDEEPQAPSPVVWDDEYRGAATEVIETAWQKSASAYSFALEIAKMMTSDSPSQNIALLNNAFKRDKLLLNFMHSAGYPAKNMHVLMLEDQRRRQKLVTMVAFYEEGQWQLINPDTGIIGRPKNALVWDFKQSSILDVIGAKNSTVSFSMLEKQSSALKTAVDVIDQQTDWDFSLYQLPIEEQSLFKGILLLPVGVLVVVFLRVLVGIKTSGTFMPVLIAMAFIQTTLLTGLIGFLLIVSIGLMIRSYLSNLNLLLISRISAVVIVVIGIIAIFTLLAFKLGLNEGLTITFFPMIILAWTIERMSILWEEEGPKEVFVQGGGSLFVAVLTYLAMNSNWIQHWVFNFLGLHLIILALVLMMGQYTGYRLLELKRFHPFVERG
ncbi:inactive transglutaminase family protein [Paraferrimonas sp. SM1919]|uniref:inactive transglutaminase family protein n=1 Tax=Paraferrimonas sp. SM1919 TaxID=2662263 RepID=UPI0013CF6741|nr:inactive transglutaminase family protein [Paraferrimonas sp. SM1919]